MEQIKRIQYMEKILDAAIEKIPKLNSALDEYLELLPKLSELGEYYYSEDRNFDLYTDENTEKLKNINRGVLSEDGIYNILWDNDDLIKKLKYTLEKISREPKY